MAAAELSTFNKQQLTVKTGPVVSRHPQTTEREGGERVTEGPVRHQTTGTEENQGKKNRRSV